MQRLQQPPTGNMTASPYPGQYPGNLVVFGPRANCTFELCPVEMSVYGYRPSLAANGTFIGLFAAAALLHAYLGFRWRSWWFMWCMVTGCMVCLLGYAGRIVLYYNPWSFPGFMIQIVLVGTGPVFFCGAIYVTLSKTVTFLSPAYSRIPPQLYIWIFIPCDAVALVLQAAGGVFSTASSGSSQVGVNLSVAGLALQVGTMAVFSVALIDYLVRYLRSPEARAPASPLRILSTRLRVFLAALASATLLILGRSAYRVEELSKGYKGPSIRNESLFIWLEGVVIIIATYLLCLGHPGLVFDRRNSSRPRDSTNKFAMSSLRLSSRSPEAGMR